MSDPFAAYAVPVAQPQTAQTASMPDMIRSASSMAGVPFDIAYRLVKQESSFNPQAKSATGAMGLTQLEPDTAKQLGVSDPWNPADNLAGGMKYLSQQYKKYGNWRDALAAYNWGPGNVDSWLQSGGHPANLPAETRAYIGAIAPTSFTEVQHGLASTKAKPLQSHLELLGHRSEGGDPFAKYANATPDPFAKYAGGAPSPTPQPTATPDASSAAPTPAPTATPMQTFTNPMDQADSSDGPAGMQGGLLGTPLAQSALSTIAGHQDIMFILHNAQLRDAATGRDQSILELGKDPKSYVSQALAQWKSNPGAARDEFGLGSPRQNAFMAKAAPNSGEGRFAAAMQEHPWVNSFLTNAEELVGNPVAAIEGAVAGKAVEGAGALARRTGIVGAGEHVATQVGMGSPLYDIANKHGVEGSQWAKATIANVAAPHKLLHMPSTDEAVQAIFKKDLSPDEQTEVGRLAQGLKPDPKFAAKHADLAQRAQALVADRDAVTQQRLRVGLLTKDQVHRNFLPMKNSYTFGPQADLEAELRGQGAPGAGNTANKSKTFQNLDESIASGNLTPDFLLANNYGQWRNASLQRVAFEDALQRAPESLRRDIQASDVFNRFSGPLKDIPATRTPGEHPVDTLLRFSEESGSPKGPGYYAVGESQPLQVERDVPNAQPMRKLDPENPDAPPVEAPFVPGSRKATATEYVPNPDPRYVAAYHVLQNTTSPTLKRSMIAPELLTFVRDNGSLKKYLGGQAGYLPGQETSWAGRFIQMARNMIVSNLMVHPGANIAGNDAAARSLYGLGGNQMEAQGYLRNSVQAVRQQIHAEPAELAPGATWRDRIGNTARAVAQRIGADPKAFAGGAEEYAHWIDRALMGGGIAEFGRSARGALGGERDRVLTVPLSGKGFDRWKQRLNKWATSAGDFNLERTFGERGEEAFAVSLFKDAVQRGKMSDAEAGQVVREALGDYYNMDPKSPLSAISLFMPWRKGNWKFWANVLIRKPQFVTAPASAIRNLNMQRAPEEMDGPNPAPDFEVKKAIGDVPLSLPFVGRDTSPMADIVMRLAEGVQGKPYVGQVLNDAQRLALGSANPLVHMGLDAHDTAGAVYRPDVTGPETSFNQIVNVKAPAAVQNAQLFRYFTGKLPVPLVGFALQNAMRKGLAPSDVFPTLASAAGLGYPGSEHMSDDDRREISRATKKFKQASDRYTYEDHDFDALKAAYQEYQATLKSVGKIH